MCAPLMRLRPHACLHAHRRALACKARLPTLLILPCTRRAAGVQPSSCAALDVAGVLRRAARRELAPQEAQALAKQLGLRMAAISTFVG